MWEIVGWTALTYLAIGVLVTMTLARTPYADIKWWLAILSWPVFVIGAMER